MRTTVDLPDDLHTLTQQRAHDENISMSEAAVRLTRQGLGRRWPLVGCVALVAAMVFARGPAVAAAEKPAPARLVTITIPAPNGEIPAKWLAYPGPPRADVLLPAGYNPRKHYPLLVLLNGLNNDYASYAEDGIVAMLEAADLDAVVVMPEGGDGWYADWWNNGRRGAPSWETYELDTVLPTILADYPILPERRYHAIAGFSMGGLGATYLGGRLPGFFGSVISLSGFDDTQYFAPITDEGTGLISEILSHDPLEGASLDPVYGPPDGFYADGHNPTALGVNLKQTRVFESTGTGVPSSAGVALMTRGLSEAGAVLVGSVLEAPIIYPMNQLYHQALVAAGVNVTYQVHAGGHDLPDFYNEFKAMLAWGPFKPAVTDPTSWTNDTVATSGQLWDINYAFSQAPDQVVRFHQVGDELTVSAAGSAVTITTNRGCIIHTVTPATVRLPGSGCSWERGERLSRSSWKLWWRSPAWPLPGG